MALLRIQHVVSIIIQRHTYHESSFFSYAHHTKGICGGGYSGLNIGRQFRVGLPEVPASIPYTYFGPDSLYDIDGSVVEFLKHVAKAGGYGYYLVNTFSYSLNLFKDDPYQACLNDVFLEHIDFCMGES